METQEEKKTNYFVRTLIVLFCLGLASMIAINFLYVEPFGVIKSGMFFLLTILLVLVLAESFDNFSIGQIVSINREIKVKQEENKKLEQKNSELITHLISITNSQTQKQQSTNVFGDLYTETPKNLQPKKTKNDNVQELVDRIGNSIVITELENNIKRELKEKDLEVEDETAKVLLRHLAGTQLLLEFERIHSMIFGSQLFLLRQLNANIPNGVTEVEVFLHFEKVKQQFLESFKNWTAEQYLSYLYSKFLITKDAENNIHLTNLGVEYLIWITRNGLREDKPL
jgi:hypothetical protein